MAKAISSTDTPNKSPRGSTGRATRGRSPRRVNPTIALDTETRQCMIAEAAYYKAEERGFAPGCEDADWLAAEQEINRRFP